MTKDEKIAKLINEQVERDLERALLGGTTTNAQPETTLTAESLKSQMREWDKLIRNTRRSQVTFVIDRAHQGDAIRHETPNEGLRIECTWAQADVIHQQWPLKLHRVLSADAAEFVPIIPGEFAAKHLPQPPYDVPPDESFEDWVRDGDSSSRDEPASPPEMA